MMAFSTASFVHLAKSTTLQTSLTQDIRVALRYGAEVWTWGPNVKRTEGFVSSLETVSDPASILQSCTTSQLLYRLWKHAMV